MNQLEKFGIVPVIRIDEAEDALPLAKALTDGGLPIAEITFRTKAAGQAIRTMRNFYPEMMVGAGTVLSIDQANEAILAGANFIVSPGINPSVVKYCKDRNFPIIPGAITPSEIEIALSFGLDIVKFFPAEQAGGIPMIKALSAPYQNMRFMPTGGINEQNLGEYLRCKPVIACGGSFMVKESLIAARNWSEITRLTKKATELVGEARK